MPRSNTENGSIAIMESPDADEVQDETLEEVTTENEVQPESTAPDPVDDQVVSQHEDPAWREVHQLSDIVDGNESAYNTLNRQAKAAKKAWEASVEDLQEAIRRHKKPCPLFDAIDKPQAESAPVAATGKEPWRNVEISVLRDSHGLPARTLDALVDAGLTTIGKLADYTSRGKLLIDLKGISEAGNENVFDAMTKFWAANLVESADDEECDSEEE